MLGFGSSSALASAYGVAVTGTMLIDTLLVAAVMLLLWKAPRWWAIPLLVGFFIVDVLFFASNLTKFMAGGWLPMLLGGMIVSGLAHFMGWAPGRSPDGNSVILYGPEGSIVIDTGRGAEHLTAIRQGLKPTPRLLLPPARIIWPKHTCCWPMQR